MLLYLFTAVASALMTATNQTVSPGSIINVSQQELPRFSEFLTEGGQAVWELVASSQDPVAQLKQLSGVYNSGILTRGNQICPYFQTCPAATVANLSGPAASDASSSVGAAFGAASSAYAHFTQTASPSDVSAVNHALSSYIRTMTSPPGEMLSTTLTRGNSLATSLPTPTPVGMALNNSYTNTTTTGLLLGTPRYTPVANITVTRAFPTVAAPVNDTKNGTGSLLAEGRSTASSSQASASSTVSSKVSSSSSSSAAPSISHASSLSTTKPPAQSSTTPSIASSHKVSAVVVATNRPVPLQTSNAADRLGLSKIKGVGAAVAIAGAWIFYL